MADETPYAVTIAAWLAQAVGDSAPLFEQFSTGGLGLALPPAVIEAPDVASALQQAGSGARDVGAAGSVLETAAGSGDETAILTGFLDLGSALTRFYIALRALADGVRANVTPTTVPDPAARAAAAAFAEALAKRMSDYALASAITGRTPQFAFVLRLLGLLDWRRMPASDGTELGRDHVRTSLELDRIKDLISDPPLHYRQTLGWGDGTFDPQSIFRLARDFYPEEDDVEVGVQSNEPFLRIGALLIRRDSSVSPPGLRLAFTAAFADDRSARVELNDEWGAGVSTDLRMTGTVSVLLTPPLALALQPPTGEITGGLEARLDRNERARPFDVLGGTGLLSVAATNAALGLELKANWSTADGVARIDPLVFARIDGLTLGINTSKADSFVGSLLADADVEGAVDLGLEWRATSGLRMTGSGGLEIALPTQKQLGPIELQTVYLVLRILPDGTLSLESSTALRGAVGPVRAIVDRIGTRLDLRFAQGVDARFGPFDLALQYSPPRGVGFVIDAGALTGGGFLSYNKENAEYVGALRLQFEQIQLSAIGILTTRLPGGEPGFSLLIIVSAAGFAPIQLGFGFTLTGVGGLLGVNRSVNVDLLRAGIRNRTLDAILFSKEDPVARAPAIVGTLRNVFPPTPDSHAFGPMARIEWGSPTRIVTLELALILQLPAPLRLIILGRLRVAHPEEDPEQPEQKPAVAINLDALGVVDFDRREAALDAALYDSKLMGFALTGEMALRASWGPNPGFALALGGFHPRYSAPVGFPRLERVALTLASLDSPRLRLESYLALTSNTVQFGSRLDFYVKVAEFSLDGKLGFDALICLDPFEFEADIAGSLTLKHEQSVLMAVAIAMTLSGPTPWHARGRATFEILGFKQAVAFDHKFGEELPPSPSEPIRVLGELTAALESPEAWSALLPTDGQLVTLAGPSSDGGVLVHPLGVLKLSQRIVPLEVRISRFGTRAVAGPTKFTIERVRVGAENLTIAKVSDYFAPAQFLEMSDDQKLASPSYEPMVAGVRVTPGGSTRGEVKKAPICYETTIIGPEGTPIPSDGARPSEPLPAGLLAPLAATGPAALAETRVTGRAKYSGDDLEVTVAETEHVVAGDDLHTLADVEATGGTYLGADEALRAYLDEHPDQRGRVRVVAKREVLA
jgi:hypothetical protein